MAGTITTIYAQSFTWNGITFNASVNGLIRIEIDHGGQPLESRAGDDDYPRQVFIIGKNAHVRVMCHNFQLTYAPGAATSNGVATVKHKTGSKTVTIANLILVRIGNVQGHEEESETTLEFVHESADGTTAPVS